MTKRTTTKPKKLAVRRATWPTRPRMQRPTVLAGIAAFAGAALMAVCFLRDVGLAGGYDFLARNLEAKVLSRVVVACVIGVVYLVMNKLNRHPQVLSYVLLLESLALVIHVPIAFATGGPGWLVVGGLAITSVAFVVASGKRVQDDLRRIAAEDPVNQIPHHSK